MVFFGFVVGFNRYFLFFEVVIFGWWILNYIFVLCWFFVFLIIFFILLIELNNFFLVFSVFCLILFIESGVFFIGDIIFYLVGVLLIYLGLFGGNNFFFGRVCGMI